MSARKLSLAACLAAMLAALPAARAAIPGELLGPGGSEEHTSELQSHHELVCRLLL